MANFKVTVWASYETEIEANTKEEAEEMAVEEAPFPYVNYCETEETDDQTRKNSLQEIQNGGHTMKFITIEQNNESINSAYRPVFRSHNHKFKPNNWLKMHHQTMRRKPYKQERRLLLDEFCNINSVSNETKPY